MTIYIAPKNLKEHIVISQLVIPLKSLSEKKNILYIAEKNRKSFNKVNNINILFYTRIIHIFIKNKNIQYIYTRSMFDFIQVYFLKRIGITKAKLIFDFRGLVSDENYLRNKSNLKRYIFKFLEKQVYMRADKIRTVSEEFKTYLLNNYGKTHEPIIVIPCGIEKVIHKKKRYDKEIISFVYIGGLSKWQNFNEILSLYKKISSNFSNVNFTIYTKEDIKAKEMVKNAQLKNTIVLSKTNEEILNELSKYDFGFLLRDNIMLNNVASPIKYLEYISRGVIPIMSEGIGDYSKLTLEKNIGILLPNNTLKKDIETFLSDINIYKKLYSVSSNFRWNKLLKEKNV